MPTNVKVDDLKINKLTKAQYEAAVQGGTIGEYELSVLTDDNTYATSEQLTQGLATKQDTISDLATIRSGAAAGATAVQPAAIADMETQTHASATYATKTELADKQDIIQYSTMPTAGADNIDDIVQFVGTTDSTYTNGHFYKCVSDGQDPATYSWEEVSLGGSSLPDQTGQSGKYLTTNGTNASWGTVNALQNSASNTTSISIRQTSGTQAVGSNCVTIGDTTTYTDDNCIAIGKNAYVNYSDNVAIGVGANCSRGDGVSIGSGATCGYGGVSIGCNVQASGLVAIGYKVLSHGRVSTTIGRWIENAGTGSICIGLGGNGVYKTNTESGCFKVYLGQDTAGFVSEEYKLLDQDGTIPEARLADTTNATAGQVLTLDSNLVATWATPSGGGASAPTLTWYTVSTAGNTLTIADTSSAQLVKVYKNGLLLQPTEDYSISGTTLTTVTAMVVGDKITTEVF